jgi:hypothetical protein
MFTNDMPALAKALTGSLPDAAVRQLMQVLGNCQQALAHRGPVSLQPSLSTNAAGLARPGAWNPANYSKLLPTTDQLYNVFVDLPNGGGGPGGGGGGSGSGGGGNTYGGNTFNFPTNSEFINNQYFGGDTLNVQGDSFFDNSSHLELTVENANITNLNVSNVNNNNVLNNNTTANVFNSSITNNTFVTFGDTGGGIGNLRTKSKGVVTKVSSRGIFIPRKEISSVSTPESELSCTVTGTDTNAPITATGSGTVSLPTKAKLDAIEAAGEVTVKNVTAATMSGIAASFSGTAKVPTGGTVSGITATASNVAVNLARSVTLPTYTATSSGISIPTSCTIEAAAAATGTVTIPVVTGASLDNNCKVVLTTQQQTFNVTITLPTFAATLKNTTTTPTITIAASGDAVLNTTLTSVTPSITVTGGTVSLTGSSDATVTGSVTITNQGTINLTSSDSKQSVTITAAAKTLSLSDYQDSTVDVKITGNAKYSKATKVTVDAGQLLDFEEDINVLALTPSLNVDTETLKYYGP